MANLRTASLIASPREWLDAAKTFALWRRLNQDPEALALWRLYFDPARYLEVHPDVARAGVDPLVHFLLRGNREVREPSAGFSMRNYLGSYPEVAAARINGLLHFALFGKREGREADGQAFAMFARQARRQATVAALSINNEWRADCPLLSVVIPCFNYGRYVEAAIRSILNQTFSNLEIIVVEGGSTDSSTVEEVRRLESLGLPKTRFYYREDRHLAGDNRNFGIGRATGRYIVCLDADDTLRSPYLELAVFLAEVFGYDIVSPSVEAHGDFVETWYTREPGFPGILQENQISTVAMFRRSAWAHVGGYRDWGIGNNHVPEDWDFWIRLLGHGYRGTALREPFLYYRVHDESLSNMRRREIAAQGKTLQVANEKLWLHGPATNDPRYVVNPWTNLGPEKDAPPGFLLAIPFITVGGAEKLFHTLIKAMIGRGWRVIVITTDKLAESSPDETRSFFEITPYVYPLSKFLSNDNLRYEFLRYLIHRYAIGTMMLAGCRSVYALLEGLKEEFPELRVVDQLFNDTAHVANNRLHAVSIDRVVVPSIQLRESLIEGGIDASRIHVIPHGIELPEESGMPAELPALAQGKVIAGFFGRMSIEKGPDLFIEIVRRLAVHRELYFVMTGSGPEAEAVQALIHKYGLEERIYTPGFVDDVMPLMRAADIMVLPSRLDGMPLAVLEAQGLGKPVVASRVGSLVAMIEDQKTGFLCEPGDVDEFAGRIWQLAADAGLRERMKALARESIRRKYGAEQMLEAYEGVFRKDLARQACGAP